MDASYVLQQLVKVSRKMRKAQKDYYSHRAPKEDPIKAAYLSEAQRREQDLDKLLMQIEKVYPVPSE